MLQSVNIINILCHSPPNHAYIHSANIFWPPTYVVGTALRVKYKYD